MFAMASQNESLRVGERNAAAARAKLKEYRIRLLAEDCGLNYGRTVEFYSETGDLYKVGGKASKDNLITNSKKVKIDWEGICVSLEIFLRWLHCLQVLSVVWL